MASSRARCALDERTLLEIMKTHITSIEGQEYLKDINMGIAHYKSFLSVLASKTRRVRSTLVSKVAQQLFPVPPTDAQQFGWSIAKLLSHCRQKKLESGSGKKFHLAVRVVVASMAMAPEAKHPASGSASSPHLPTIEAEGGSEEEDSMPLQEDNLKAIDEIYGVKDACLLVSSQSSCSAVPLTT